MEAMKGSGFAAANRWKDKNIISSPMVPFALHTNIINMKKFLLLLSISLLCFWSCGGQQKSETKASTNDSTARQELAKPKEAITIPAIPADYTKLSLSKIGLEGTVMAPLKTDMQKSTVDDNEGIRNLYILYPFRIITGDSRMDSMGGISAELDICTTEWTLLKHKEYVQYSSISRWNKFVKEEPDYCIYTTDPTNSMNQPLRAKDGDVYQFMMIVKNRTNNKQYIIRSSSSSDFTADEMLKLFAIAKSIEIK